jgi:hypothetical protein
MKAELKSTTNYDLFEMHECNRDLHDSTGLLNSMRQFGFMPSSPIQCIKNGHGKLKVIRGHHRLTFAKQLKLPVLYVIDPSNTDIYSLEGSFDSLWTGDDFVHARAKAGDINCQKVLAFQKKHDLPLGAAASLVGGESAGSTNKTKQIKSGTFHIGDMKHANDVVRVTDLCRELGIPFATSTGFVKALSLSMRIPSFDVDSLIGHIRLYPRMMNRRSNSKEYLEEIEQIYNYAVKRNRLPIVFKSSEISRQRQKTFGGKNKA